MNTLKEAFARFGITNFETKLAATSMDGASVNMGKYTGLAARLKELAPWITAVHCFSHRLELAAEDAFNATFFTQLDEMLRQLFSLYQKSPKRLRELRRLAEVYEKSVDKPVKALLSITNLKCFFKEGALGRFESKEGRRYAKCSKECFTLLVPGKKYFDLMHAYENKVPDKYKPIFQSAIVTK